MRKTNNRSRDEKQRERLQKKLDEGKEIKGSKKNRRLLGINLKNNNKSNLTCQDQNSERSI